VLGGAHIGVVAARAGIIRHVFPARTRPVGPGCRGWTFQDCPQARRGGARSC
jgi:hypothetical protein